MHSSDPWYDFFANWPTQLPQQGVVITTFQETIPFTRFMLAKGTMALERDRPDTMGARKVVLAYTAIAAVKMTDTGDFQRFAQMGFEDPGH